MEATNPTTTSQGTGGILRRNQGGSTAVITAKKSKGKTTPKTLVLKLAPQKEAKEQEKEKKKPQRRGVTWTEDTVDNEHLNRKKSNICCIYHAPRERVHRGEISESPSTDSSDDANEYERSRQSKKMRKKMKKQHGGDGCCNHNH